jgi:nitroreductase
VELSETLRRRVMCRTFSDDPVDQALVERILREALRSPTAGNTAGTAWVALSGNDQTSAYWSATTDDSWRARHPEWSAGLMRAPVVLLSYTSPASYVARYAEPDKDDQVLGTDASQWPVPYWFGDAAFGVMAVLLQAVEAGLGACVLGNFRGEPELADALCVPEPWRLFCAVALGRPAERDRRSPSLRRASPTAAERIHFGRW